MSYCKNAPRFSKGKFKYQFISDEFFEKFQNEYPQHKDKINIQGLKRLWDKISRRIGDEVVQNRLGVVLNNSMGELKLQYLPYKCSGPDHHNAPPSFEEKIRITSILTKGKFYNVIWERKSAARYNSILNIYAFEACSKIMQKAKDEVMREAGNIRVARPKTIKTHFYKKTATE